MPIFLLSEFGHASGISTSVETVDEVLKIALTKELKTVQWIEVDPLATQKTKEVPASRSTN